MFLAGAEQPTSSGTKYFHLYRVQLQLAKQVHPIRR